MLQERKASSNNYTEQNRVTRMFLYRYVYFSCRQGNVVNNVWEKTDSTDVAILEWPIQGRNNFFLLHFEKSVRRIGS